MTRQEMLHKMRTKLAESGIESADYEARVLLEWILQIDRSEFYMNPDAELSEAEYSSIASVVEKRARRIPLQYIMETADFMGYDFYVNENVLIPRMDTECLVERAIEEIQKRQETVKVLDLCCGSGCIGISIQKICPNAEVTLADISDGALSVAKENAKRLNAKVSIVSSDLFEQFAEEKFDFILSNPPYIPTKVIEELMPEVRDYEPILALDGTADGLFFYERISEEAPIHLEKNGVLLFEIGAEQGSDVKNIIESAGFEQVAVKKDLAGLDRNVFGVKG